jgi:hypothetical protein
MSMPAETGNPLWQAHIERLHDIYGATPPAAAKVRKPRTSRMPRTLTGDREAEKARHGEWTARPPGRLGRRLLADVEPYLEFFAIARAD